MRLDRIIRQRLRSLFRRSKAEADMQSELALHLEQLVKENLAEGMSEGEARSSALREFGPLEVTKEQCRDLRRVSWLGDCVKDVRFAVRSLSRSPAFSLAAVLTVALAIGVNTAVFSVIHTVLLDPLPYRAPERLVHVAATHPDFPSMQVAAPDFFDFERTATSFDSLAAHTFQAMNKWTILGDGEPEPVQTVQASAALFPLLGVQPVVGRAYTAEEEATKAPVVLLSESLWRRKYGADPSIAGRTIRLVTWPVTVVGIVPQRQAQPSWADVWMPLTFLDPALVETRRFRTLEVMARLKSGVTVEQAQAEMTAIAAGLEQDFPETNGRVGAAVRPLASWITGEVRPALLIAWAAASLVLLLACANLAHLVLVRTVHRAREMAVRAALGAGRARLTRFLLAENLVLAMAGGLLGAALAWLSVPVLLRLAADEIPRLDSLLLSPAALVFGGCATIACATLFALPAILHSRNADIQQAIKQSGGLSLTHRRSSFGSAVIAAEIALAFVVLAGASLLYRSFVTLLHEDTGIDSRSVLAADVPLALNWEQSASVFEQRVAPTLRAIPGVTSVAAANCGPMVLRPSEASRFTGTFRVAGRTHDSSQLPVAQVRWITPDYFHTLRIPLVRGHLFTDADIGKPGYIINQALAQRYFPNRDPVGQHILYGLPDSNPDPAPVIGVVGDVRDLGLDIEPSPTLYSLAVSNKMTVLIRTQVAPASLIPAVRSALRAVSPDSPVTMLAPLDELIESTLTMRRFALELLGVFAALASMLTVIGVYGIISYSLSQRTSEFAIRFALGADRGHIRNVILRDFAVPTVVGLLLGLWVAHLSARALQSQLYKLSPADPIALSVAASALLLIVLVSALRPASKAASISPAAILRE